MRPGQIITQRGDGIAEGLSLRASAPPVVELEPGISLKPVLDCAYAPAYITTSVGEQGCLEGEGDRGVWGRCSRHHAQG
jgi:hypothetical protein